MPRPPINGHRHHVILTEPQHKALNALSKRTGLLVSELHRRAIDLLLHQSKKNDAK